MTAPILSRKGFAKSFGRIRVLHDSAIKVQPSEVLCLLGHRGAGKTIVLRCPHRLAFQCGWNGSCFTIQVQGRSRGLLACERSGAAFVRAPGTAHLLVKSRQAKRLPRIGLPYRWTMFVRTVHRSAALPVKSVTFRFDHFRSLSIPRHVCDFRGKDIPDTGR